MLSVSRLTKRFGGFTAVNEVSFDVARGEILGLIGPNGSGKSTTFNVIAGLYAPTAGSVKLDGREIGGRSPNEICKLGLARTFQISQLYASFTPTQSLALAVGGRRGVAWRWWRTMGHNTAIAEEVSALLEQFRLSEMAARPTRELPYGKRRLLEIAMAVALQPEVLLLDEPAAGVPAAERQDILDTVAALPASVSVVLIEHDMDLVFSFANWITVLVNGAVLTEGPPRQIADDPQVRAVYLGETEVTHDGH